MPYICTHCKQDYSGSKISVCTSCGGRVTEDIDIFTFKGIAAFAVAAFIATGIIMAVLYYLSH